MSGSGFITVEVVATVGGVNNVETAVLDREDGWV
jgi:hypothetical protein